MSMGMFLAAKNEKWNLKKKSEREFIISHNKKSKCRVGPGFDKSGLDQGGSWRKDVGL